jgi:predicted dienelactone hydrolase
MRLLLVALLAAAAWAGDTHVEKLVLKDGKREKDLQIRITYPEKRGTYPLLVFSHGAFGSKDAYEPLIEHWASHGYVCIQATHSDSLSLGGRPGPGAFRDWKNRPKDVSFVLDSLDEIERRVPDLKGALDREKIGVGGHSFGAHTSQLVGGVKTRGLAGLESHRDRRVRAALLISPQGRGRLLGDDSWKAFKTPAMVITGSNDKGRNGEDPKWRLDPYALSPAGDKYLVWIEGAYHGFGGITGKKRWSGSGPDNADHVSIVKKASLAFWDAYVKEKKEAKALLESDAPFKSEKSKVRFERK